MIGMMTSFRSIGRTLKKLAIAILNAIYKTITRTALYALTLALVVYFTLNSSYARDAITDILNDALPGTVHIENIQYGPIPWKATILGVDIRDPRGTMVIAADRVVAHFDMGPLGAWLTRRLAGRHVALPIVFEEANVYGANVTVASDAEGWLGIREAFDDSQDIPEKTGPGVAVTIRNIGVHNTTTHVDFEGFSADLKDVNILAKLRVADGHVDIPSSKVSITTGDAWFPTVVVGGSALHLPIANFVALDTQITERFVAINKAELTGSTGTIRLDGRIDTDGPEVRVTATGHVKIDMADPLVQSLSTIPMKGRASLIVRSEGPVSSLTLSVNLQSDDLGVHGLALGPVDIAARIEPTEVTEHGGVVIHVQSTDFGALDGIVHLDHLTIRPGSGSQSDLVMEAGVRLSDIDPSLIWTLDPLADTDEPLGFLAGRMSGSVSTLVRQIVVDAARTQWYVEGAAGLDIQWDGADALSPRPTYGLYGLVSGVFGADELRIETPGLMAYSDHDEVVIKGSLDVANDAVNIHLDATAHLDHLNSLWSDSDSPTRLAGTIRLTDTRISGSLLSPEVHGDLHAKNLKIQSETTIEIPNLSTTLAFEKGLLTAKKLRAEGALGRLWADLRLGLFKDDFRHPNPDLPLTIQNLRAKAIPLHELLGDTVRGTASVRSSLFQLDLGASDPRPRGKLSVSSDNLVAGDEAFKHIHIDATLDGHRIRLNSLKATTRSGGRIAGTGTWNPSSNVINLRAKANQIDLAKLGIIRSAQLPARGLVDLTVEGRGTPARLSLNGILNVKGFGWGGIELGSASIQFRRKRGSRLVLLESDRFFPTLTMSSGRLELSKQGIPVRLTISADAAKTNILAVLPEMADTLHSAKIRRGQIQFDQFFDASGTSVLTADIPAKGLHAALDTTSGSIINQTPLWLRMNGDIIAVDPTIIAWGEHRLALCGFTGPRNLIHFDVAGTIDLGSFPQLRETLADAKGRLITHGPDDDNESFFESCLLEIANDETLAKIGNPKGILTIRNTMDDPAIDGELRVDKLMVATRGRRQELAVTKGVISIQSPDTGLSAPLIRIDDDHPLIGTLDDRAFVLKGSAILPPRAQRASAEDWLPDTGRFHLVGKQDFEWSSPDGYELSFSPNLVFEFDKIQSGTPTQRSLSLKGDVVVTQGTVYKSFNKVAQAFSNMLGRTVQLETGPLSESVPILSEMILDVHVSGNNMRVKSTFDFAGVDVDSRFDLQITETIDQPQISGWMEITEGSITYKVVKREFEITDGKLEFSGDPLEPEISITAETTIERSVSSEGSNLAYSAEDENVVVSIRLSGTPSNIDLKMDSRPSYSAGDVHWLILTGRTKSEFEDRRFQSDPAALNVLGADLAEYMTNLLRSPFIKSVEIAPLVGGGGQVEVITRLGRAIRLNTTVRQEHGDTSYHAGFRFKINDRVSLEGRLRGAGEETDGRQTYETKFKYSIPLD
jgi:hypothetical protein